MRTLVIGDSWALDWPIYAGIPGELAQGVGGSTAKDWAENRGGILRRAAVTDSDSCVICLIGNDVMGGVMDWRKFIGAEAALDKVVRRMTGRRRWLVQYTNPTASRVMGWVVHQANVIVERVARRNNVGIIPTWQFLRYPQHFRPGDIHMNSAGAQIMGERVWEIVT